MWRVSAEWKLNPGAKVEATAVRNMKNLVKVRRDPAEEPIKRGGHPSPVSLFFNDLTLQNLCIQYSTESGQLNS